MTCAACCVAAGYTAQDYQVGVLLLDRGQTIRGTYAHVLDAKTATTFAGEVNYDVNQGKNTTIIVGCAPFLVSFDL